MKFINANEVEWSSHAGHRQGNVSFKPLITGLDGTPGNFVFSLVRSGEDYTTPRHRHNFDQIRYQLEGSFGYSPDQQMDPGQVGYFGEGTYYTQRGINISITLLLQLGGANGNGIMSFDQRSTAFQAMKDEGDFHDGIFTYFDEQGKKHNIDGFEALWQQAHGELPIYPEPRYGSPILMQPDNFHWVPSATEPGVSTMSLGVFNERHLALEFLRLEKDATHVFDERNSATLLYVREGAGTCGDVHWVADCAIEVETGESMELHGEKDARLLSIELPHFDS